MVKKKKKRETVAAKRARLKIAKESARIFAEGQKAAEDAQAQKDAKAAAAVAEQANQDKVWTRINDALEEGGYDLDVMMNFQTDYTRPGHPCIMVPYIKLKKRTPIPEPS